METQENLNFKRIAETIDYIKNNFKSQPTLDEVAEKVHLSPLHFQRMFTEWAGTSPKKFLQYISIEHAKKLLKEEQASLFDTAFKTGLSSTSRLHDLFVNIEGMTPAEYKNGGKNLSINYSYAQSPFGPLITASTDKGVCYMAFEEDDEKAIKNLTAKFPNAGFQHQSDMMQQKALSIFQNDWSKINEIKLHLKGTDFQLKVWESLLKIPMGKLSTYGHIARQIGNAKASRAVGTAIGSNPIAFLIPCHRVIQSSGIFGGYMWGASRKAAMIGWEQGKIADPNKNWLPYDGTVYYYGKLFSAEQADFYLSKLLESIEWRNDEAVIFGRKIITKRKVAWYGEKPYEYTYSNTTKHALPWTKELLELKSLIEKDAGESFNSCLLNLYHNGDEGMAWHSDAEKDLKKNGAIASLSFGAERKFAFKHKHTKEKVELLLEHGSLLVMKDVTQSYWLHRLPPTKRVNNLRVNLTFRSIVE